MNFSFNLALFTLSNTQSCDDVYASVKKMETTGVEFSKKPDEGR